LKKSSAFSGLDDTLLTQENDTRLHLPVIAMDEAVLYDIREKQYLKVYVISYQRARQVLGLVKRQGLSSNGALL